MIARSHELGSLAVILFILQKDVSMVKGLTVSLKIKIKWVVAAILGSTIRQAFKGPLTMTSDVIFDRDAITA